MEISPKLLCSLAGWIFTGAFSWAVFRSYRQAVSLSFLFIGTLSLRIATSLYPYLHFWDEKYHALVAKNLCRDAFWPKLYPVALLEYDYKDWAANYTWMHKQPLTLWAISAALSSLGNNEFAVRVPSIILSSLAVLLTFLIGKKLVNERVGYWAAFFHAVNGWAIEMSGGGAPTDHVDVFFAFFIELAVGIALYADVWKKKWNIPAEVSASLTGAVTGLAILSKWLPALIVLPVYLIAQWQSPRLPLRTVLFLLGCAAIALPWQFYAMQRFPQEYFYEMEYNSRHFTEMLEGHRHGPLYYLNLARISWNELIYLPLLWLLSRLLPAKITPEYGVLFVWITIPYLFFSMAATKMPAYVFFTGPAMFVALAAFIDYIRQKDTTRYGFVALLAISIVLSLRFSVERLKPLETYHPLQEKKAAVLGQINALPPQTVVFNAGDDYIDIMFYTDYIVFPRLPFMEHLQKIHDMGFPIVIMNRGHDIPREMSEFPGVTIMNFVGPVRE